MSRKIKHRDGFIGCRTPRTTEDKLKKFCAEHTREISEVVNYLCRLFIEDASEIRTKFFINSNHEAREEIVEELLDQRRMEADSRGQAGTDPETELGMS
jgi:hypothetical protein